MRPALLHDESGFTLIELVVATGIALVLMAGLSNLFVSGLRASSNANQTLSAQSNVMVALNRLEFEARCASAAALVSGGAGVTLTLPSQCTHAAGTFTWCSSGGALTRHSGSSCSGSGEVFASDVTSTQTFSCLTPVGQVPRLQIALTVSSNTKPANEATLTDVITLRNAPTYTSGTPACA
jgi:prepilin-type N-terminal cleavage/methylation domain-containing protein